MTSELRRARRPSLWPAMVLSLSMLAAIGPRSAAALEVDEPSAFTKQLITDAVAEYDARRFEEARALFRQAHDKEPSARTLRGIGMASFELRDYVEATRALTASLAEKRRPLTPEQRQHVQGLLARAETFVGRFTPRVTPADASLTVDGRPAQREPDGSLLLSFGQHRIVAACPGCQPAERDVSVAGGEREELKLLALAPAPLTTSSHDVFPAPPEAAAGPAAGTATTDESGGGSGLSAAHWLVGGAALAAVGAVAAGIWWHDRSHELDVCRAAGALCLNQSQVASQRDLARGLTLGAGAVAVAAGVAAAVLWPREDGRAKLANNIGVVWTDATKAVLYDFTF